MTLSLTGGDDRVGGDPAEVADLPVVDVAPRPVVAQQLVVVGPPVARPLRVVPPVRVLAHRRVLHERDVAAHCRRSGEAGGTAGRGKGEAGGTAGRRSGEAGGTAGRGRGEGVTAGRGAVFQLGLFLRALCPARFTRVVRIKLKKIKKKKKNCFIFTKCNWFLCFQTADVKMLVKCLQICAHVFINHPQDQILLVHG